MRFLGSVLRSINAHLSGVALEIRDSCKHDSLIVETTRRSHGAWVSQRLMGTGLKIGNGLRVIGGLALCLGMFALVVAPNIVSAEGFRIIEQSASGTAQGGAFAAQADDPSAIHFNPAGMTQLRRVQVSFGTNIAGGSIDFTSSQGLGSTTGNFGGTIFNPPPSNFYLTANLGDLGMESLRGLSVGLGVTSPFGIQTRYPNNAPFRTSAIFAALPLLDIKPTFAYRFNKHVSVGAGADIYTFSNMIGEGHFELQQGIPGLPAGMTEVNGNGTTAGYNFSVLVTPWLKKIGEIEKPIVNLGVVYRSAVTFDLSGDFLVNGMKVADAEIRFPLPDVVTVGMAYWPVRNQTDEWKLEFDIDYVDWSDFDSVDVTLSNAPTVTSIPQNWNKTWVAMVGTEYKWLDPAWLPNWNIALRAGYVRSNTPIPARTFNPAVPGADYNAYSTGVGVMCHEGGNFLGFIPCGSVGKAMGLDLAYQAIVYEPRTVLGNQDPSVDGTYNTIIHVGAVNMRVNF